MSAIFMWDNSGLCIAIPKKRGKGYLKTPLYHNYVEAISDIEFSESTVLCGIDGYLQIEYGHIDPDKRAAIGNRVMPLLAAHYKFKEWREDREEFWKIVMGKR